MEKEQIQTIKIVIEDLLSRLSIDVDVDVTETVEGPLFIIRTQEGGLLLGENGKNFIALSHIIKKIVGKKTSNEKERNLFSLDINDYQAKKIEDLKNLARVNAQKVRYFKKEIVLRAMTSFERRIIHMVLVDCPDVETDSKGEDPNRQVVIRPYL